MPVVPPFESDSEIEAIGLGLFDRTLPKAAWTHAAHFAAALWVLMRRPDLEPSTALPPAIRAYNASTGVANTEDCGYHETITQASIRAARDFIARGPSCSPFEACNALLASSLGTSTWPLAYWSHDRLFSRAARREWIEPDLQPLPF